MAVSPWLPLLLILLLPGKIVEGTTFTLQNLCNYTLWPGILSGNEGAEGDGGFALAAGSLAKFKAPPNWSGRFWARTGCTFDASGSGKCVTGDCGGTLKCARGGEPPVTLAEFPFANRSDEKDFYDVSLVDGYNVALGVSAVAGTGDCQYAGCVADLNVMCPVELQVTESSVVVACSSACSAFNSPEFCCTGEHDRPETCSPTKYSELFKNACPTAYSYAYDDASSTRTCSGSDYLITFCPMKPSP